MLVNVFKWHFAVHVLSLSGKGCFTASSSTEAKHSKYFSHYSNLLGHPLLNMSPQYQHRFLVYLTILNEMKQA